MASFFHGTGTGAKPEIVREKHQTPVRLRSIEGQACYGLVRELFGEYLREHDRDLRREWGVGFDADAVVKRDMGKLGEFGPPSGLPLMAFDGRGARRWGVVAYGDRGGTGEGEDLRMAGGQGSGRGCCAPLAVIEGGPRGRPPAPGAGQRPDHEGRARTLYRSAGLRGIGSYPESEIPERYRHLWVFVRLDL